MKSPSGSRRAFKNCATSTFKEASEPSKKLASAKLVIALAMTRDITKRPIDRRAIATHLRASAMAGSVWGEFMLETDT